MVFIYSLVVDAQYGRGGHSFRDPEKQSDLLKKNATVTQDSLLYDCLSGFMAKLSLFPPVSSYPLVCSTLNVFPFKIDCYGS